MLDTMSSPRSLSLDSLLHDARFAVRSLLREPVSSAATILVLALALGLNLTTFRVMDVTLFEGYRLVRDNERLLYVDERYPTPACCVTYADYEVWRAEAGSFQDAVARAAEAAKPAGVVLLAPACASFDMFRDYAERGRTFKEEVARIAQRER